MTMPPRPTQTDAPSAAPLAAARAPKQARSWLTLTLPPVMLALSLGAGMPSCPGPGPGSDGGVDLRGRDLSSVSVDLAAGADLASRPDLLTIRNSGDCNVDADCSGGRCVELSPGGFRVCKYPVAEATACGSPRSGFDQCCTTADCATGRCYAFPITPYCGGAAPIPHNSCADDSCRSNADCAGTSVCAPAGALGNKTAQCLTGSCLRDTDCTAEPGGICAPVKNTCCAATRGLFCVYPKTGCREDRDCPSGHCEIMAGRGVCQSGPPLCPP